MSYICLPLAETFIEQPACDNALLGTENIMNKLYLLEDACYCIWPAYELFSTQLYFISLSVNNP